MRSGELSKALGVSDNIIRRLAKLGLIPARRLPTRRAHWNFADADLDAIRTTLIEAGLIEEAQPKQKKK